MFCEYYSNVVIFALIASWQTAEAVACGDRSDYDESSEIFQKCSTAVVKMETTVQNGIKKTRTEFAFNFQEIQQANTNSKGQNLIITTGHVVINSFEQWTEHLTREKDRYLAIPFAVILCGIGVVFIQYVRENNDLRKRVKKATTDRDRLCEELLEKEFSHNIQEIN